jgi:hypothetical protein
MGRREARRHGALAWGIKVSRAHLLALLPALLPEEPRKREEALRQNKPAERKLTPKVWLAKVRKEHPRQPTELLVAYARRLLDLMPEANVTKAWSFETLLRRLYDK